MKKGVRYLTVLLLLAAFSGGCAWLLATTAGARWLVSVCSRFSPVPVHIDRVTGRVADRLILQGIRLDSGGVELRVAAVRLDWQPLYLMSGMVAINEVAVRGISIDDRRTKTRKGIDLTWPRPPRLLSLIKGYIRAFDVEGLTYRAGGGEPIAMPRFFARVVWYRGTVTLREIAARLPGLEVKGDLHAGLLRPALHANLRVTQRLFAGYDRLSLVSGLIPGRGEEQLAGPLVLVALTGSRERAWLKGEVAILRSGLRLRAFQLREAGRQGSLTGQGTIDLGAAEPSITLLLQPTAVDLSPEMSLKTSLSGTLEVKGTTKGYQGLFALRNEGSAWKAVRLSGSFDGDLTKVALTGIQGSLLDGTLRGELQASWAKEFLISGRLMGRGLNPALITPDWTGQVNLNLDGSLGRTKKGGLEGDIRAVLPESRLRGMPLHGVLDAGWHQGILRVSRLELLGSGFEVRAKGAFQERLAYEAAISDLSGLIPGVRGRLDVSGWGRWRNGRVAGALSARGSRISAAKLLLPTLELDARADDAEEGRFEARLNARNVAYNSLRADVGRVKASGTLQHHTVEVTLTRPGGSIDSLFQGGYAEGRWSGLIDRLSGADRRLGPWALQGRTPLEVSPGDFKLGRALLTSSGESMDLSASLHLHPLRGSVSAAWQRIDLSRANPFLNGIRVTGRSNGKLQLRLEDNERLNVVSAISAEGTYSDGSLTFSIDSLDGRVEWGEQQLLCSLRANINGSKVNVRFSSHEPPRFAMPDRGDVQASVEGLDVSLLRPWLPTHVALRGELSGQASGRLLPDRRLDLSGETSVSRGAVEWRSADGLVTAQTEKAVLAWKWQEGSLSGGLQLTLANYGSLNGTYRLPVPARLPLSIDSQGPVQVAMRGEMHEKGMLAAFFPGLVKESQAQVSFDCAVGGTWADPRMQGRLSMSKAEAYLPPAGIRLQDVSMEADFSDKVVRVTSFRVRSGSGYVNGAADIYFRGTQISRIQGTLKGDRFQAVYLPELQAFASPDLTFEGTPEKMVIRGVIKVPELSAQSLENENQVLPSKDAVIVDATERVKKTPAVAFDAQVRVLLGERVTVKTRGVDARLEGEVLVTFRTLDDIRTGGEIRVAEGQYASRGFRLKITRGRAIFNGGKPDQGRLDILALRTIDTRGSRNLMTPGQADEVKAGVIVTGTMQSPVVRLYSEPAMPDADILSYIAFGKPLGMGETSSSQTALLGPVAGALLLSGAGSNMKGLEQLKRFAPDTLDVKPEGTNISQSLVTVGKYLSPQLYVGIGRSLFSGENYFTARYTLSRRWEIESKTGSQTGANLYYKIEFD